MCAGLQHLGTSRGYFDGDGTIYFSDTTNQPYKLSVSLVFVDQSMDQIRNVRDFLRLRGIRTSNILRRSDAGAYELAISEFDSVKDTLRQMLPFLCKKAKRRGQPLTTTRARLLETS